MIKRKRTEKSKYKHKTTGDYCTCAAYIAEMMCLRIAEKKGVSGLGYKFWNKKPWDWTFKKQLFAANNLISKYGEKPVIRAIEESKNIFSLNNKIIVAKIEKLAKIIQAEEPQASIENLEVKQNPETRKKTYGKKTTLGKLRGLNGKKGKE